jgi:hypothetical protein
MYLDRESQPPFNGLYEDMHIACIRIRVMHLRLVNTRTHMGDYTYRGLGPSRDQSSQSTIRSNRTSVSGPVMFIYDELGRLLMLFPKCLFPLLCFSWSIDERELRKGLSEGTKILVHQRNST